MDDLPFPGDDAGIEHHLEFPGPALLVGDVEHDETLEFPHLVGGQPQSRGGVHGLGHIVDETLQLPVDLGDLPGLLPQHRIG